MSSSETGAAERLARALSFRTISAYPHPSLPDEFSGLLDFIEASFPRLFAVALVQREDPWRLIVHVPGTDRTLDPILLLAHFDVVAAQEDEWSHPPFGGLITDGYIWGRGALDDKGAFMAILEAAEAAVSGGTPERGFVLAFGGDEELAGHRGAKVTAGELAELGRRFHFILDEGSAITDGVIANVPRRIALIGLGEKGLVNIRLVVEGTGGHAGRPPDSTALGALARAITRVEAHPFPAKLLGTVERFFRTIGKVATGPVGLVYRHPRLFWPILRRVLAASSSTNAIIRTTQAVTMASGSSAPNVLPAIASCTVNVRILPGQSLDDVTEHYHRVLRRSAVRMEIDEKGRNDVPAETPSDHDAYHSVKNAMNAADADVVVTPFIITDSTDSKHYLSLSDAILRFVPMTVTQRDLESIHGCDERVSVESYERMIRFYSELIHEVCFHGRSSG